MAQNRKVRFIRKRGRIIPIAVKNEIKTAKEFGSKKNRKALATVAGASVVSAAGMFGAGRLHRSAMALEKAGKLKKAAVFNRVAKLGKFGIAMAAGKVMGTAIASIDKKSGDERSKVLNLGSEARTVAGHVAGFALAYGGYRMGKRFEYAGKLGKNLFKMKDIKSMTKLKAI